MTIFYGCHTHFKMKNGLCIPHIPSVLIRVGILISNKLHRELIEMFVIISFSGQAVFHSCQTFLYLGPVVAYCVHGAPAITGGHCWGQESVPLTIARQACFESICYSGQASNKLECGSLVS